MIKLANNPLPIKSLNNFNFLLVIGFKLSVLIAFFRY